VKTNAKLNEAIAYLHGKIEAELNYLALAAGLDASMVAARVGALLCGAWQRAESGLPMRMESAYGRAGASKSLADVEGGKQPHGHGAPHRAASKKRSKAGKKVSGIRAYWAAMTPEQRSAEMAKRLRKAQKRKEAA
jgi:hypothetical protein